MKILLAILSLLIITSQAEAATELFEDSSTFINGFDREDATASIVSNDVYFGTRSIRIACPNNSTRGNLYARSVSGWAYNVVANPQAANEVRWMMFAWKKIGADGIMVQLSTSNGWGALGQPEVAPPAPVYRYFAGNNFAGWSAVRTGWYAPAGWQVVIRDLYADFGPFTLKGIALTPFNGTGLFDSIYVAQSYSDIITAFTTTNTVVSIQAPAQVNDGQYFDVDITISDASNVSGFSMTIHYDHNVIRARAITEGSFLKSKSATYWMEPDIDNSDNLIHQIMCVRMQPGSVSGSGTLLTVSFRADEKGESPITLGSVEISDAEGQVIPVAVENTVVVVDEFPSWDVNRDGIVGIHDFIIVGQNFGKAIPSNANPNPDINGNGQVDMQDLVILAQHFGEVYWDAAPGGEMIPLSAKPVLEAMLELVLGEDEPDATSVSVIEKLIDQAGRSKVTSWGSIKAEGRSGCLQENHRH